MRKFDYVALGSEDRFGVSASDSDKVIHARSSDSSESLLLLDVAWRATRVHLAVVMLGPPCVKADGLLVADAACVHGCGHGRG